MANLLYPTGKAALLGAVNLATDTIKALLVDATYTYSAAHDNLDDITAGKRVGSAVTLTGVAVTAGKFSASDTTFPALAGAAVAYVVIYKHTGVEGTSSLIAIFDTVTGIPYTPVGNDLVLHWNAAGILAI